MKDQSQQFELTFTSKYERNLFSKFCLKIRATFSIEALIRKNYLCKANIRPAHKEEFIQLFKLEEHGVQ